MKISELKRAMRRMISDTENINLVDSSPLLFVHLMALSVFFVGFSWAALGACLLTYFVRVFALTGGYHRYFSHRSYRTSRVFQFVLAWLGACAAQCGPLWWASHHRHHHRHSDQPEDMHSPRTGGFLWAHVGWLLCRRYADVRDETIRDFARFPELRLLDRFHVFAPVSLAVLLYWTGELLPAAWGTSGWQFLAWGFFFSTMLVYHVTWCINSLTHMVGRRRFDTGDDSRNNFFTALLTMGEGWHNNHHHYPVSTRQGFAWYEIDMTYYLLRILAWCRLVWDIQEPPRAIMQQVRREGAA